MSAFRNVEELLDSVPPEDRMGYFEELPEEVQDAFWAEFGAKAAEFQEAEQRGDVDRFDWLHKPRVGRLWGKRKYPAPRSLPKLTEGDVDAEVFRSIPPAEYIPVLAGVEVPAWGSIPCPFPEHEDTAPSLKVYETHFICFGCHVAGDIFNFAAALWGLDTKRDFRELVNRLASCFGLSVERRAA